MKAVQIAGLLIVAITIGIVMGYGSSIVQDNLFRGRIQAEYAR